MLTEDAWIAGGTVAAFVLLYLWVKKHTKYMEEEDHADHERR